MCFFFKKPKPKPVNSLDRRSQEEREEDEILFYDLLDDDEYDEE